MKRTKFSPEVEEVLDAWERARVQRFNRDIDRLMEKEGFRDLSREECIDFVMAFAEAYDEEYDKYWRRKMSASAPPCKVDPSLLSLLPERLYIEIGKLTHEQILHESAFGNKRKVPAIFDRDREDHITRAAWNRNQFQVSVLELPVKQRKS